MPALKDKMLSYFNKARKRPMIQELTPPLVLIVDDNPTNIDILVSALKGLYRLGIAKSGRKAIDYAVKNVPQLILLDIMMPGMDGFEVIHQLKSNHRTRDTEIIFITAVHDIESKTRGFELGAVDYITKPFSTAEVRARVKIHLSLISYRNHLEEMVKMRTHQLEHANVQLSNMQSQIIQRLGKAAEYKDEDTGKHVIRVSVYSSILAEKLGLDADFSRLIRVCSPMHDLGKIGIPDHIILKKAKLDPKEWDIMKQHCNIGADILAPIPEEEDSERFEQFSAIKQVIMSVTDESLLQVSMNIAKNHHEKWDGTGYPNGLRGSHIPIEARITTIADIYDALSSKRTYKEAYSESTCQGILREYSGYTLDPDIVDAFFDSIDEITSIKSELMD